MGRPPDVSGADTKVRILAAARTLFADSSYAAVTVKAVATAADLTPPAVYRYFPTKALLYKAVWEQSHETIYGRFRAAIIGQETLRDQFVAIHGAVLELDASDRALPKISATYAHEIRQSPELQQVFGGMPNSLSSFLRPLVEQAAARGEIADGISVESATDLLVALTAGLGRIADRDGHESLREATGALIRLLDGDFFNRA